MSDDLAPHKSNKPKYTFLSSILILLLLAAVVTTALYFLQGVKSLEFLAGAVCATLLWNINYRNCYGKWFDY